MYAWVQLTKIKDFNERDENLDNEIFVHIRYIKMCLWPEHLTSEWICSSGTSAGERKLMPTIQEEMDRRQLLYSLLMPVMSLSEA